MRRIVGAACVQSRAEFAPKFSICEGRFIDEDEDMVSAEIGCAPPISQPLREFIRHLMNSVPHQFVTVDMRGLKAALIVRAQSQRVSVSVVVRDALRKALSDGEGAAVCAERASVLRPASALVKVSIRLTADEAARFDDAAKATGLSRGAFLSGLVEGVPVLASGGRSDVLRTLIAASAELSTLSRNVRNLANLLARAQVRPAQEYRSMLDTLAGDVDRYLRLVGQVLQHLQPSRRMRTSGRSDE